MGGIASLLVGCGAAASSASGASSYATAADKRALATISGKTFNTGGTSLFPSSVSDSSNDIPDSIIFDGTTYSMSHEVVNYRSVYSILYKDGATYTLSWYDKRDNGEYSYGFSYGPSKHYKQIQSTKTNNTISYIEGVNTLSDSVYSNVVKNSQGVTTNYTEKYSMIFEANGYILITSANAQVAKMTLVKAQAQVSYVYTYASEGGNTFNVDSLRIVYPFVLDVQGKTYQGEFTALNLINETKLASPLISVETGNNIGMVYITNDNKFKVYLKNETGQLEEIVSI